METFIFWRNIKHSKHSSEDTKIFSRWIVKIGPTLKKVRLLLRKLVTTEYSKLVDYILPKKTSELEFSEAVKLFWVI